MNLLRTLLAPLSPAPFCLDIGANEGGYIWSILQARPEATVHAFEPLHHFYKHCERRFAGEPNVHILPLGISNKEEYVEGLAVHEAWTLDKPERAKKGRNAASLEREGPGTFPVMFTTVDAHIRLQHTPPPPVEFIKLDTDGYEARVLAGATATLLRDRPLILIELSYMVDDIGDSVDDMLTHLYETLGYRLLLEDGSTPTQAEMYAQWPWHTSFDAAAVPVERLAGLERR